MSSTRKIGHLFRSGVLIFILLLYTSILGSVISRPTAFNVEHVETAANGVLPRNTLRQFSRKATIVRNNDNHNVEGQKQETVTHIRKPHLISRIINGQAATKGRYPYIVSLTSKKEHRCGGSLIAPDIVLSAAHCKDAEFDGVLIGRYNIDDNSETFEHFVVEAKKMHPLYESESSDTSLNYDFMIIKLFGRSGYPTIKINGSPDLPSYVGDSLNVMGWGVVNTVTNELASILQEVEVKYMSNEECEKVEGYFENVPHKISLNGQISEAMICAKDEGEDACQGDSGGPLIISGKSPIGADDLLVGVVSWGLGCAHQHFPGVYARISNQIGWINKWVCEWSEAPPQDLGKWCKFGRFNNSTTDVGKPNLIDDPSDDKESDTQGKDLPQQLVTVIIHLDRYPQETGWLIRSKLDTITTHVFAPIGAYSGQEKKDIVQEVYLDVNREYEFIMLDSYGDGLQFDNAEYFVYRNMDGTDQILAQGFGADFTYSIKHTFSFPYISTQTPTAAPVIFTTPTVPPTSRPTMERAAIFIEFKFDKFPEEVGWDVASAQNGMLVGSKPFGSYAGNGHNLVTEKVWLYGPEYGSQTFTFVIHDSGNNGLCCDHGPGYYKVYLDEVSSDNLLFGGDLYSSKEQYNFVIEWPSESLSEAPHETNFPVTEMTDYPTKSPLTPKKKIALELLRPQKITQLESLSDSGTNIDNIKDDPPHRVSTSIANMRQRSYALLLGLQIISTILFL